MNGFNLAMYADCPFICDLPAEIAVRPHISLPLRYTVTGRSVNGDLSVEVEYRYDKTLVYEQFRDEYMDAIAEGRLADVHPVRNGLPHVIGYPLPQPLTLFDGSPGFHVAIKFTPPCPPGFLLQLRALLSKGRVDFTFSGFGKLEDRLDFCRRIIESFRIRNAGLAT